MGLALLLAAAPLFACPATAGEPVDHCFVISIDGCAARFLPAYDIPNLRTLTENGSWTLKARTVSPSLTLPATASMVSGLTVRDHGIDWDAYAPARGTIRVTTIFTEAHNAGRSTAMFVGYPSLEHLATRGAVDVYQCPGADDSLIMDSVIEDLFGERRNLYFIQLPQTEAAGRQFGWGSGPYQAAVERADRQIGRLLEAIAREHLSSNSAMIVTSDHGGHDRMFGTGLDEDMVIPWILAGRDVRAGYQITDRMFVLDTAATALAVLGVPIPDTWAGRVPPHVLDMPY